MNQRPSQELLTSQRLERARALSKAGDLVSAIQTVLISRRMSLTLSEILVLGLWQQGVRHFFVVFGYGSTEVGDVLRVYGHWNVENWRETTQDLRHEIGL